MKRILITGANSYIGTSFESYMKQWPDEYQIDTLDMIGEAWEVKDFSEYDSIFHVAGIAHVSKDKSKADLYYKVNRDLTIKTAEKAKKEGVTQFIFMSSIIVYQDSDKPNGMITRETIPVPADFYGDSKLQAEKGIESLNDDSFNIVVIRPPMIYGKGSKGNYPKLAKFAKVFPVFPDYDNKRSMLHIDNLCEFIRLMIANNKTGLYFPQNNEFVKTSDMVKLIAMVHDKKILMIKIFNPLLRLLDNKVLVIKKVFGNLYYDMNMSEIGKDYSVKDLIQTIELTEGGN